MAKLGFSRQFNGRFWAVLAAVAFGACGTGLSACGALSSPERQKTPSSLLLQAQAAYDAGNYSKAVELLESVIEKDPSNDNARVHLVFSYNGSVGITPTGLIKTLLSSSSTSGTSGSGSDVTKLTSKSGLPDSTVTELKKQSSTITTVAQLRKLFPAFATFQKSFLTLCPLFSTETISSLKTKAASAVDLLEVSNCGSGRPNADANVSIAAMSLSLAQFSSLYKAVLDPDGDGVINLQSDASKASTDLQNLSSSSKTATEKLATLNSATATLTNVASQLKGEVFKLAISQFSVIEAVVDGANLPSNVKDPLKKGVSGLTDALAKINGYLDAGKSTGAATGTGETAKTAAANANTQADTLLAGNPAEKPATCNKIYCFRTAYGLPTGGVGDMPSQCTVGSYSTTCSQ